GACVARLETLPPPFGLAQPAGARRRRGPPRRHCLGGSREIGLGRGGERGLRPFAGEGERDAAADAAAAARDDHDLVLEFARHSDPPCLAYRRVLLWRGL